MGAHYKGFEKFNAFNALTRLPKGFPRGCGPRYHPSLSHCLIILLFVPFIVLLILVSLGAGLPAPALWSYRFFTSILSSLLMLYCVEPPTCGLG
jgi:hypothetical protein